MDGILGCFIVLGLSLAVLLLPQVKFGNEPSRGAPVRLLSSRELSSYNGEKGSKGLYLAVLGQVFDVNKGIKHYGPGGAYHSFSGGFPGFRNT